MAQELNQDSSASLHPVVTAAMEALVNIDLDDLSVAEKRIVSAMRLSNLVYVDDDNVVRDEKKREKSTN